MNRKVIKSKNPISLERAYTILRSPVVTEKATTLSQFRQFVFKTTACANKVEIKKAVEKVFKVKVEKVNTLTIKGKNKRFKGVLGKRSDLKKAIVTLEKGHTIDVGTGI